MKNRKAKCILVLVITVLLTACSAGNKEQETGSEDNQTDTETLFFEYKQDETEKLILYANESIFFSDEDNEVFLTVRVPSDLPFDSISIIDDSGELIGEIEEDNPQKTEENYREYSFEEFFSGGEPGVRTLTASMGGVESAPLDLYFTGRITVDMLADCSEVGMNLSDYLAENSLEDLFKEGEGDKCLEAVLEWLEADDRILDAEIVGDNVMYHTTDHVLGIYTPPCEAGSFGSSGGRADTDMDTVMSVSYPDSSDVADALQNQETLGYPGNSEGEAIYLDGVLSRTNSSFLVMTPWEDTADDKVGWLANHEIVSSGNNHLEMAEKYHSELGYTVRNTGYLDSLIAILNGDLSNYGIITLMCHGNSLERSDKTKSVIFFWPGTANGHNGRPLFESIAEEARSSGAISEEDEFYQLFYHEGTFSADHTLMALDGGAILVGGNYIIQRYQDTFFDNTIFYTGACWGGCDKRLISFCIDHGMQAYIGCENYLSVTLEPERFDRIFKNLKKVKKNGHTEPISSSSSVFTLQDNLYCEAKHSDWRIVGIGTVQGKVDTLIEKVKILEDGTAMTEQQNGEPVVDASVSFYRFMDQHFENTSTVRTASDGSFTVDDLNWGVYGIEVDTGSGEVFYSGMTLADDAFDAGALHVARPTAQIEGNVYVEGSDGQIIPASNITVSLTPEDIDSSKGDIDTQTGQNGIFCITDITPGDYILTIYAKGDSYKNTMTVAMSTDYEYEKIVLGNYEAYYSSPLQDYREYEEYAKNNKSSFGFADQRQLCQIISQFVPDGAKVCYRFLDLNNDGFKELLIGTCGSNSDKVIVHDIYTKGEGGPVHVLEQRTYMNLGERYKAAFDTEYNQIYIAGSFSAFSSYVTIYSFDENSTSAVYTGEYIHDTALNYGWEYCYIDNDRNEQEVSESEFSNNYEYAEYLLDDNGIFHPGDWYYISK